MAGKSERSFGVAVEAALVLFGCAAAFGAFHLWRHGQAAMIAYAVIIGVPSAATAVFLAAGLLVRELVPTERLKFPLNITLPIVFAACTVMMASLISRMSFGSIVQPFEQFRSAEFWLEPRVLLLTMLGQFLSLSAMTMLRIDKSAER